LADSLVGRILGRSEAATILGNVHRFPLEIRVSLAQFTIIQQIRVFPRIMVPDYPHTHAIKPARTRMGISVIWSQETVMVKPILDNVSMRTTYALNQTIRGS
jgi:hypothetical protein